ncbi:hypothetical protein KKH27_14055, partial [bacterium]|nr:hypothetical protein [bacterium]MBU1983604.1 hypothetical protein [bacterium]
SVNHPTAIDESNGNFVIGENVPPVILHDPLDDQDLTQFTVTTRVIDERPNADVQFHCRPVGGSYSLIPMPASGYPGEYAATAGPLTANEYEYYLTVRDSYDQTVSTAVCTFRAASACATELAYDDGTAEASHWAADTDFRWAVKFSPAGGAFALCGARIGVSISRPTTLHTPLQVQVLVADGAGGMPGSLIFAKSVGSVGNVIGGGSPDSTYWADVRFRDGLNMPLAISGDFYIAVSNPILNGIEAFLHDTSGTLANRSFVYDGCTGQWRSESVTDSVTKRGNRLIRASGFSLVPPQVTAYRVGNDVVLRWNSTGAPLYRVYSSTSASGPFETIEGTTSGTVFTDEGAVDEGLKKMYIVKSVME